MNWVAVLSGVSKAWRAGWVRTKRLVDYGSSLSLCAVFGFGAVLGPVEAGNFSLTWGTAPYTWTAGSLGPNTYTLTDQYGFQVQVRLSITQTNGTGFAGYPADVNGFGTQRSIGIAWDPPASGSIIGGSPNVATMEILNGSVPLGVNGLTFRVTDIDAVDNNVNPPTNDRCDHVTITGNAGNPTLTAVTGSPVFLIGPGPGAGSSPALAANQAQCNFQVSTSITSGASASDDNGSVTASFPNNTHTATVTYNESIRNVFNTTNTDAAARGIGVWSATAFTVDNTISLDKQTTATGFNNAGDVIPYTFVITNNGPLPIQSTQNIQIQDSKIGTFTCGTIPVAGIPAGGTHSCTANYTVTAADATAGVVTNTAVAGVGTGTQSFASRLQSNSDTVTVPRRARLTLVKTVTNDNGGTQPVSAWTLAATGPTSISGASGSVAVTNVAVLPGTYTLSETGPAGYAASSWSCTAGTLSGNSLTLGNGQTATCTINNNDIAPRLTLVKTITGDGTPSGVPSFTLSATGPVTISGVTGAPAVTNAAVNAGTYTLSETGPSGYAAGTWSCTGGSLAGSSLTLSLAQSATCTINNVKLPTIRLTKISVGGVGPFTFTGNNGWATQTITTVTSGVGVTGATQVLAAAATATTLTESAVPASAMTAVSCAGTGNGTQPSVNLTARTIAFTPAQTAAGSNITCTVTNTSIDAVSDDFSSVPINSLSGGTTASVLNNDTLAGAAATTSNVSLSLISNGGLTGLVLQANGRLAVPAGTSPGTYTATYRICSIATPTLCDTATAVIVVSSTPPSAGAPRCGGINLAVNGGIETPFFGAGTFNFVAPGSVPGWSTNDTAIEIWGSGFNGVPSHTGVQFMEMNAHVATSILVQRPSAIRPRAQIDTFWAHRGRLGNDTARVTINDNGGGATVSPNFTSGNTAWTNQSLIHIASATASSMTMSFQSISSTGGAGFGNFIDTVEVCQTYLTLDKTFHSKADKDESMTDTAGDVVTYQFAISNPAGNHRSLNAIAINDNKIGTFNVNTPISGDSNTNGFLDPGETWIAFASYVLTQNDIDAGAVTNIAFTSGNTATNNIRSDNSTVTVRLITEPALTIRKSWSFANPGDDADGDGLADVGDIVTYTYQVTNTGNVTITNVSVNDVHNGYGTLGPITPATVASLAPSSTATFKATYTVVQGDIDNP